MATMLASTVQVRPQPVGVFPFPAGLLLLPPAGEGEQAALAGLLAGDAKTPLPAAWKFFGMALNGDVAGALAAIEGDDALARYNRSVLGEDSPPDGDEWRALSEAAKYATGRSETLPRPDDLDGELQALLLMLHGTQALEKGDRGGATAHLKRAVAAARSASPAFAAQLLCQLAAIDRNVQHYREALAIASGHARAEIALQLGMALQDGAGGNKALLLEAVKAYQDALRFGITIEGQPQSFALLQNNLALAYLAMPLTDASEQLRMGIAVQSLREALKVYTKETYPEEWASAKLNLANALQYIPTSHPEENLIQAVEIYDEILNVRQKAYDPVGYARLLANQANALAHLGIFAPAMEKIGEAYKLFQWHNETEMAAVAMKLVENINRQRGQNHGSA